MGYKRRPRTFLLSFEDEEYKGLEIEMKGLSVEAFLTLSKVTSDDNQTPEQVGTMFRLFTTGLKSWNMEDEDGKPLPPTYDSVLTLDSDFVMDVLMAWMEGIGGVDKDLGKGSDSGETSPVPLPPMELL